ncbi:MAG: hypothetical protein ACTHK3_01935 [Solirubrobacterales bacterium]
MKKIVIMAGVVGVMVIGISACGGAGDAPSNATGSSATSPSNEKQELEEASRGDASLGEAGEAEAGMSREALSALRANGGLHGDTYVNYDATAAEQIINGMNSAILEELAPGVTMDQFTEAIEADDARLWREREGELVDYCGLRVSNPEQISAATPVKEGEEIGFSFGCDGER